MKHIAQKARKEVEAKMREKAKKQRITEEKKKKWMEYLQQLQDKILVKDTVLLEGMESSQVTGTKYKEVILRDEKK